MVIAWPKPGQLYSHKCARISEDFRMLDDNETIKGSDIIWANAVKDTIPVNAAGSFNSLLIGGGYCYQLHPKLFDIDITKGPVRADQILDVIMGYNKENLEMIIAKYQHQIKRRTYSIWRQKIKLEKRDWQAEQPPIP